MPVSIVVWNGAEVLAMSVVWIPFKAIWSALMISPVSVLIRRAVSFRLFLLTTVVGILMV